MPPPRAPIHPRFVPQVLIPPEQAMGLPMNRGVIAPHRPVLDNDPAVPGPFGAGLNRFDDALGTPLNPALPRPSPLTSYPFSSLCRGACAHSARGNPTQSTYVLGNRLTISCHYRQSLTGRSIPAPYGGTPAMRRTTFLITLISLSAHAGILARGRWRLTVHSPYLNTTYMACNSGKKTWMLRQNGQKCHTTLWTHTGHVLRAKEVCRQAMPNGQTTITNVGMYLIISNNRYSYSGRVRALVHTPFGVVTSQETIEGRWLSRNCSKP